MRFEVLRRDGFRCRYCGVTADDGAKLHVDHVIPESLGGETHPRNLVASCVDCNIGKSSSSLDAEQVDDIAAGNEEYAQALREAIDDAVREQRPPEADFAEWLTAWSRWKNPNGKHMPLPNGVEISIKAWLNRGFTISDLVDLIPLAMNRHKVNNEDVFRYYAGIVWNTLRKAQEAVSDDA